MIKKLLLIFLVCLFPAVVSGAVCTAGSGTDTCAVSQNGAGADYTAAQFNALSGDYSNDTFYFSGTFTTRIVVDNIYGDSGGQLTLDGWNGGDCSPLDNVDGEADECASSADLTRGMAVGNQTDGPDYITIQDFRMTNQVGDHGFQLYAYQAGTDDQKHIDHCIIRRNYVRETNSTLFSWYGGRYNIIKDNKFVHFGQNDTNAIQGINLIEIDHSLFTSNEFGHDDSTYPSGSVSANIIELHGSHHNLWEYNDIYGVPPGVDVGSGIAIKEFGNAQHDIIFRFNKVHDNKDTGKNATAVTWGGGSKEFYNGYFYGNLIYQNDDAIQCFDNGDDSYWWSNIITNNTIYGFGTWNRGFGDIPNDTQILNNTFARSGIIDEAPWINRAAIYLGAGTNFTIKNNLFYDNNPSGAFSNYHQFYEVIGATFTLEHNTYFHNLADATLYYNGAVRTFGDMQGFGFENVDPDGEIADPGFANPDGVDTTHGTDDDDYRLTAQGTLGDDLSQCFSVDLSNGDAWFETQTGYSTIAPCIEDALDPDATDWTTTPPTVSTVKRGTYGWVRGAYAFGVPVGRRRIFFVD